MPLPRALLAAAFFLYLALTPGRVLAAPEKHVKAKPEDTCNGVFLTYTFISGVKEYPHVKNATAQSYAFKATATILNTMTVDLEAWEMFIGFQHREILVSTNGAVITDNTDYPAHVGKNGTTLAGSPMADLLNAIDTAGDLTQMQATVDITGTYFGVKLPAVPMPKTIKLANAGFKCPAPTKLKRSMHVCCVRDPKLKKKPHTDKFLPRRYGDITIAYDVLQAYGNNYLAQVTIDSNHPLARLDNWNLTWEWARGEFIQTMRGAYTLKKDASGCFYGPQANSYGQMDWSQVMNCERKPVIVDLPPERANDSQVGKIPYCCRNGTLLPPTMDPSQSKAIFQLQVFKMPPDWNRTALYPPQSFRLHGVLNPDYKCGPAVRVSPMVFPDPSGLMDKSYAIASWQVVCSIARPAPGRATCCVSFSAYYYDSVIPCNTCACGCPEDAPCNADAPPLLLPPEGLLIPAENRTAKAEAWARLKHRALPRRLPCWDNCGVSINWHVASDYRKGWTARMTLFNWGDYTFKDWFAAVKIPRAAAGYDRVFSFNGTRLNQTGLPAGVADTVFFQGLEGLTYLMAEVDGKDPETDYRVPGKQQSVMSFTKKATPGINIRRGDGFPARIYFNGEECAMPRTLPTSDGHRRSPVSLLPMVLAALVVCCVLSLI